MTNPYSIHEEYIKAIIQNWYAINDKVYDVTLTNQFKK